MEKLIVRTATGERDLRSVRNLCWDYRTYLQALSEKERQIVETFYPDETAYGDLMARLTEIHAPPKGSIRLAELDGAPVGCGMSYGIAPGVAEIKRVFVRKTARGYGAGRALCEALIADIRATGYHTVMLDTSKSLTAARRLYESLGFHERGPFYDLPPAAEGIICFYEKTL